DQRLTTNDRRPFLATDAAEINIPRIRPDLQHRSATVELTLCSHRLWPPRSAFTRHMNIREVSMNGVAVGDFDLRPNGDRQIIRQINRDVAGRCFKRGIVATVGPLRGEELHDDSACRSFCLHRHRAVQLDTAAAGLGLHTSFGGSQPNTARAGFNFRRPSDLAEVNTPAAGRSFHPAAALVHTNAAAAGLQHRPLQAGKNEHASAPTFRFDLALGGCDLDTSSARLQIHAAFHAANINRAPTGFRNHLAADIIDANASTTAAEFDAPGNRSRVYVAAPGL